MYHQPDLVATAKWKLYWRCARAFHFIWETYDCFILMYTLQDAYRSEITSFTDYGFVPAWILDGVKTIPELYISEIF